MEVAIIGVVTGFNFLIILIKVNMHKYENAAIDAATLGAMGYLFKGTVTGLEVAMIGSLVVTLALFFIETPITKLIQK